MNCSQINKIIPIIIGEKTIFNYGYKFEIPIYQRGYEWEEEHIDKLIDDIISNEDKNYYLGILVISKNKSGNYEIIDGQQRLTTLYLILKCLGKKAKNLIFSHRAKSTQFLNDVDSIIIELNNGKKVQREKDNSMYEKFLYIYKRLSEKNIKEKLNQKLSNTYIIVTELDSNVDLNHYFEIMNIRGEQLLQSDIVKSKLMNYLTTNKDRKIFSELWEACSDINSYIQMNFKPDIRRRLFGNNWSTYKTINYKEIKECIGDIKEIQPSSYSIKQIISSKKNIQSYEIDKESGETISIYNDSKDSRRYSSIIEFKHFLLHVLKVFADMHAKSEKISLDEMIEEKKTTLSFELVFEKEFYKLDFNNKCEATKEFISLMLKSRFLFDNYMIKRELKGDTDGEWSLQRGKKQNKKDGIYFINSFDDDKSILMLQSLLRVTYTNPRQMHWITKTLLFLNKNYNNDSIDEKEYATFFQNYIRKEIRNLDFYKNKDYYQGFDTHHILFNYLDYLLWKSKKEYKDFSYEYRNSVEHYYPRNPDINNWDKMTDENRKLLDSFGNLCLITTSLNSHFSNLQPSEKKYHCEQDKNNGNLSLKLREMFKYINENKSNEEWKNKNWKVHQEEMLNLLLNDVEINKEL